MLDRIFLQSVVRLFAGWSVAITSHNFMLLLQARPGTWMACRQSSQLEQDSESHDFLGLKQTLVSPGRNPVVSGPDPQSGSGQIWFRGGAQSLRTSYV